jgi:ketosteroid isomerase-like protein
MSTPEGSFNSFVEAFNAGDTSSMVMLYEADACTVSQLGHVVKGREGVRQSLKFYEYEREARKQSKKSTSSN